jgi:hypothetical protein
MIMAVVDSLRAVKVSSSFKTSCLNVVNTPSTYEMLKVLIRYLSAFALQQLFSCRFWVICPKNCHRMAQRNVSAG